jgi:hypothetical protein
MTLMLPYVLSNTYRQLYLTLCQRFEGVHLYLSYISSNKRCLEMLINLSQEAGADA